MAAATQTERILALMLESAERQGWLTLEEISAIVEAPEASVSAQLRHLRKPTFGRWTVLKRKRTAGGGMPTVWEYLVPDRVRRGA